MGTLPNILVVGVVMLLTVAYWDPLYDLLGEQPEWAHDAVMENATDPCRI